MLSNKQAFQCKILNKSSSTLYSGIKEALYFLLSVRMKNITFE